MSDLRAGGTAPHDPFTETATGLALVLLLAGVASVISVFNSRPVRISIAILALGFIGGIVAGAI